MGKPIHRFRQGDMPPNNDGKVFNQYWRGLERWVTPEQLAKIRRRNLIPSRKQYLGRWHRQPSSKAKQKKRYASRQLAGIAKMQTITIRFKIGDPKPDNSSLVFLHYKHGIERWVTPEFLEGFRFKEIEKQRKRRKAPAVRKKESERSGVWSKRNSQKVNAYRRERRRTDPQFAISERIRNRIRGVLTGRIKKTLSSETLLGCSFSAFKIHFESQFIEGMSCDKVMTGEIHIDHHVPCARFDLIHVSQQLICFNFENLKPMWAIPNIQKSDKIIPFPQQATQ